MRGMEETIEIELTADEVLVLAKLTLAQMEYLAKQGLSQERDEEMHIIAGFTRKILPSVSQKDRREEREDRDRLN